MWLLAPYSGCKCEQSQLDTESILLSLCVY